MSIHDDIDGHIKAVKRGRTELNEMIVSVRESGGCCPSCAFSPRYGDLVHVQELRAKKLERMLVKRDLFWDRQRLKYLRHEEEL